MTALSQSITQLETDTAPRYFIYYIHSELRIAHCRFGSLRGSTEGAAGEQGEQQGSKQESWLLEKQFLKALVLVRGTISVYAGVKRRQQCAIHYTPS